MGNETGELKKPLTLSQRTGATQWQVSKLSPSLSFLLMAVMISVNNRVYQKTHLEHSVNQERERERDKKERRRSNSLPIVLLSLAGSDSVQG